MKEESFLEPWVGLFFGVSAIIAGVIFFGPSIYLWRHYGESTLFVVFFVIFLIGLVIELILLFRRENKGLFILLPLFVIAGLFGLNTYFLWTKVSNSLTSLLGLTTIINFICGIFYLMIALVFLVAFCHFWLTE
jgi:hypothetical protein